MKLIAEFKGGIFITPCPINKDVMVGSVLCCGHPTLSKIKPCKFFISSEENNTYYLPILKEEIKITSSVNCGASIQGELF